MTRAGGKCWRRVRADHAPAYCAQHKPGKRRASGLSAAERAVVKAAKKWDAARTAYLGVVRSSVLGLEAAERMSTAAEGLHAVCAALAKPEDDK
jgi:hypothetical protein